MDIGGYGTRLGVTPVSVTAEAARLALPFKEENSNPGQALHGGVAASMIDFGGLLVAGTVSHLFHSSDVPRCCHR